MCELLLRKLHSHTSMTPLSTPGHFPSFSPEALHLVINRHLYHTSPLAILRTHFIDTERQTRNVSIA